MPNPGLVVGAQGRESWNLAERRRASFHRLRAPDVLRLGKDIDRRIRAFIEATRAGRGPRYPAPHDHVYYCNQMHSDGRWIGHGDHAACLKGLGDAERDERNCRTSA